MTTTMNGSAMLRNESKYVAHNMIMEFVVSKALKAVLLLGVPDILSKAGKPLSAAEILEQLPTRSTPWPKSSSNLRRLLRPLVRKKFFTESNNSEKQPVYGLTDVSKWFLSDSERNMTPCADLQLHPVLMVSGGWDCLHDLILDETDGIPFEKARGVPFWEFATKTDPEFGVLFQDAMAGYTQVHKGLTEDDLQQCGVLDGVNTLVDVGGNRGAVVAAVVSRNPHIQGVNFDLPEVIATAPAIIGVRHVAGSFFEELPSGDAMLVRAVIHNHGDEACIKILENCFQALPKNGKVILVEYILTEQDKGSLGIFKESSDLIMLAHLKDAKERTQEEYESLLLAAGFRRSAVIWNEGSTDFIVGYKE